MKGDAYAAGNILLDIQYEHNGGCNRCYCYAYQAGEKASKKAYGDSLGNTFSAYGNSFWIKQSVQSDVPVIQNYYKNDCCVSAGG